MKRNFLILLLVAGVLATTLLPALASEDETTSNDVTAEVTAEAVAINENAEVADTEAPEYSPKYLCFVGEIETFIETNGTSILSIVATTIEGDNKLILHIAPDTLLYDIDTLTEIEADAFIIGHTITAYYHANTPMLMSFPGQLTPEVVLLNGEGLKDAKADIFDVNGLSSDGELVINLTEETPAFDFGGNEVDASTLIGNLSSNALLVFYGATTMSLPPQTSPELVIVMKSREQKAAENLIASLDETQLIEVEGVKYVLLRDVAESLGFDVAWVAETSTALLTRGVVSYSITIGATEFGFNRAMFHFENVPFILNDRTYVEIAFINQIVG